MRGTAAHTAAWMGTCVSFSRLFSAENKTEPPTLESSWRAQYFFSVVRGCKNPLGKADLLENHLWSVLCQRVWYVNWHKHRMNPSRAYTELLHFPQRDVAESADPKVLFHSDLRSQLICRLLITAEKGASENKTYFHEKKKKSLLHMCFVVKGNIYHHQTPACQNMFPLKQKIALKMREKTCAIERRNEVHESFPNSVPPARSLMSRQRCSTVTRRCREGNKEISKLHLFSNINFYIFSVNYDVSVTFLYPSPSKKKAVWGGGTSNCS